MADDTKPRAKTGRKRAAAEAVEPGPSALAGKAHDLDALRGAVVDAAGVGAGLWFSYLFVLLYLLVAVGSVTHRDLLLESPIRLPFLGVELPLVGFFVLGPLLFLIVHAYVLLHFVLLAGKVGAFHSELQAQIADEGTRTRLRRQLPSNIFVQILAGPREVRTGVLGFMLRLIAQISLVAGPVALLVFFQLQFLPYHHDWVTWWHRLAVLLDLALLWMLWPSVARGRAAWIAWRDFRRRKVAALALASLAPLLLVFTIATFPGEWLHETLPEVRFVPVKGTNDPFKQAKGMDRPLLEWTSLHVVLIAGEVHPLTLRPTSLWSNRLVSPYVEVVDRGKFDAEAKFDAVRETFSLRARRLEKAVLTGARLRKVDFTGAHLQGATLAGADLREARFMCAGSLANCTDLQGALFANAQLQGAALTYAHLQGANLDRARLQGASLDAAQLQGANLNNAELQGASLIEAKLQGASLFQAQLQGALLDRSQLQGARLDQAQLQGASLRNVELDGASLDQVFVWRADLAGVDNGSSRITNPRIHPFYRGLDCQRDQMCAWSVESFVTLRRFIEEQVPKDWRGPALSRIATLDPGVVREGDTALSVRWTDLASQSPLSAEQYENVLTKVLQGIGCDAKNAPYVVRSLIPSVIPGFLDFRFAPNSQQHILLATIFLDEAQCPGARGLSEAEKEWLRLIGGGGK